jgi:hypothetical protein
MKDATISAAVRQNTYCIFAMYSKLPTDRDVTPAQ